MNLVFALCGVSLLEGSVLFPFVALLSLFALLFLVMVAT